MIFLLLSILASGFMLILFKFIARYNFSIIYPIIINYYVAFCVGLLFSPPNLELFNKNLAQILPASLWLGTLFIVLFFFIGKSTQKAGIRVTGIATRISVIIPMSFALLFYDEKISIFKLSGIILALPAVLFSSLKINSKKVDWKYLYLPLLIFLGSGIIDSSIEYSQHSLLQKSTQSSFTILVFIVAAVLGTLFSIVKRYKFSDFLKKEVFLSGLVLGILNYSSLYFIISALKTTNYDDSIVFGFNNIGVLLFSAFVGIVFYHEKTSKLNILGILLSLLVIFLLSLQV